MHKAMAKLSKHSGYLFRSALLLIGLIVTICLVSPAIAERHQDTPDTLFQLEAIQMAGRDVPEEPALLSPYWGPNIQQWSDYIAILSAAYGFHPDFIAAVIRHESDGDHKVVSYMGAVGLMGIMPAGPGLEWRPSPEELLTPTINLRWGMAILSTIMRQSGGDVYAALAAYNGGWDQISSRGPRDYAAGVLDSFARAVVVRHGLSPEMAAQWTIAIEMEGGHVPSQTLLILGNQPLSGLHTFAAHTIYQYADEKSGRTYYVRGYAVPVALLAAPGEDNDLFGSSGTLEEPPDVQSDQIIVKAPTHDPRVLLACLPSLERLRGYASTRWYAPSNCPSGHR
jgi:hypothetical protein